MTSNSNPSTFFKVGRLRNLNFYFVPATRQLLIIPEVNMHEILSGFEFILRGGFMMYPLLLSALIALTVILERIYAFSNIYKTPKSLISEVTSSIRTGNLEGARKLCETKTTPISELLLVGVSNLKNSLEEMELAMKNQAEKWVPHLEKRIGIVDTVITAAPLMGLLGTITGMMASFRVLSEKGVNEPNAITGGVAEALIATATGLVIALLCLIAYNYLTEKVKNVIYDLERAASQLTEARLNVERSQHANKT
jgi:biopolymer transport protein ExbB